MKKYLKFVFKGGLTIHEFDPANKIDIDCPNDMNGIGDITFHGANQIYSNLWFKAKEFSTQFCDLLEIYTETLCEDDAPELIWKVDKNVERKSKLYSYWYSNNYQIKLLCNKVKINNNFAEIEDRKKDEIDE